MIIIYFDIFAKELEIQKKKKNQCVTRSAENPLHAINEMKSQLRKKLYDSITEKTRQLCRGCFQFQKNKPRKVKKYGVGN